MSHMADRLCMSIMRKKSPVVIGLDPVISRIPLCYFDRADANGTQREIVADGIARWGRDIIDSLSDVIPAVKPQIAFFEMYGSDGIRAFETLVRYAHEKDLLVIEDGKRNDIGNTAKAYAEGHLGQVEMLNGTFEPGFGADFLTVSPYLGSESLQPFIDVCVARDKGIFVLVRTSNSSSGEVQDAVAGGQTVSLNIAAYLNRMERLSRGTCGYSSIGAVVGATYPEEGALLRKSMPRSLFLVPGYGTQGGTASDVAKCFNPDGLGAIVNASRSVLYGYEKKVSREACSRDLYRQIVRELTVEMKEAIYHELRRVCAEMTY